MNDMLNSAQKSNLGDGLIKEYWPSWTDYLSKTDDTKFLELINKFLLRQDYDGMMRAAEEHFYSYPNKAEGLIKLYVHATVELGNRDIAQYFLNMYFKLVNRCAVAHEEFSNLPMVVASNWFTSRVGEFVDQTAAVKRLIQTGKLKEKPLLCIGGNETISNSAFFAYATEAFEVITNKDDFTRFSPGMQLRPLRMNFFYHSDRICDHSSPFLCKLDPELERLNIEKTCFNLDPDTIERSLLFLRDYDLNKGDNFVVLHLRAEGYCDYNHHKNRNTEIVSYLPAIRDLLDKGFKIVRIGHKKMPKIEAMTGLIDLTYVDRPDEVDIYLCAMARFYFGSGSGPYSLANCFGTPSLLTGHFPTDFQRPNVLAQFARVFSTRTGKKIPFKDISNSAIRGISSPNALRLNGLRYEHPSQTDIREAANDMLDFIDDGEVKKVNIEHKKEFLANNFHGNMCMQNIEEF